MLVILTIDTNIWASYFDKDSAEHKFVAGPVDKAIRAEQILTNTVIVMELSHFLVKNLGPVEGGEKINFFLSYPLVIEELDYKAALGSCRRAEAIFASWCWWKRCYDSLFCSEIRFKENNDT